MLREQKKWRIKLDEDKEWTTFGKHGVIHELESGDNELDVWVTSPIVANRMKRSGWKAKNNYDDGALFIKPFDYLDKACIWIKAGKRRQMTEAQKALATERLKNYRKQVLSPKNTHHLQKKSA